MISVIPAKLVPDPDRGAGIQGRRGHCEQLERLTVNVKEPL